MPKLVDITGNRYGRLTVLGDSGKRRGKKVLWHCICDCGNECDVVKDKLTCSSAIPSCGCQDKKKKMYVGYRVGMLTVTKCLGSNGQKVVWECSCDCGNTVTHTTSELNFGGIKSCGCLKSETGKKLRKYNTRDRKLYYRWSNIRARCYNLNNQAYKNYGERGIAMCEEWKNDFYSFRDWAVRNGYKESLSLDRIDNDKGYSPDNCRWTDDKTQSNNRRNNRYITINGVTKTLMQWAEDYGIHYTTIQRRIKNGWSEFDAITKPTDKRRISRKYRED